MIIEFIIFILCAAIIYKFIYQYIVSKYIITECISIESDEKRRVDLLRHINNIGFKSNLSFFKAVTGDDISEKEYKDYINIVTKDRIGRIGCWLSHVNIWKKYIGYNEPILVIEDDVRFEKGFTNQLKSIVTYLKQADIDWDLCFLGREEYGDEYENISLDIHDLEFVKNKFYQTHCYLVNCKNIDKLLKHCDLKNIELKTFKNNTAIDVYISNLLDKLNVLGVKNQLAIQVSSENYGSNTG
jgi:GR25 family glycosyltransferase involved in LPS biosynthesis